MKTPTLLIAALIIPGISPVAAEDLNRPNVLFLVSDDLRPDLGCYGNAVVKSPNIDAIAAQGLVFNRAYCQQAVCSPSRSSVMTGARPDTTGVTNLTTHFRKAMPDVVTLPQLFKNHGYTCRAYGKIYHGDLQDPPSWSPEKEQSSLRGLFDSQTFTVADEKPVKLTKTNRGPAFRKTDDPPNGGGEGKLADEAIAALKELKDESKPFFLAVGFHKPHLPFSVPKFYWDLYDREEIPLASNYFLPKDAPEFALVDKPEMWNYSGVPDTADLPEDYRRDLKHGYYAAISYMDAQLGRVVDELDALGLRDNTIIILWGDHGWKLGEHRRWAKHSNVEDDTRAPLIIDVPGMNDKGAKTDALVEFVDIYPTLADLAGLPLPEHLEGSSLKPLIEDPNREWKDAAFSQYPRSHKGKKLTGYSMRTDRYRFTRWVHTKDHSKVEAIELYDHEKDPQENVNIAKNPENKALIEKLTKQAEAGWKGAMNP
ncbi:sulfatase [Haloferula chungangensis]|uniref:Sulfatase n=1 Tax=Haloferula chungangensis TaxID=1048331 RepID=A0ABW2L9U1_9BACT